MHPGRNIPESVNSGAWWHPKYPEFHKGSGASCLLGSHQLAVFATFDRSSLVCPKGFAHIPGSGQGPRCPESSPMSEDFSRPADVPRCHNPQRIPKGFLAIGCQNPHRGVPESDLGVPESDLGSRCSKVPEDADCGK